MSELSRRGFLSGIAACAIAPALPPMRALPMISDWPPIFAGSIGTYNGIIFRESTPMGDGGEIRFWSRIIEHDAAKYFHIEPSLVRDLVDYVDFSEDWED